MSAYNQTLLIRTNEHPLDYALVSAEDYSPCDGTIIRRFDSEEAAQLAYWRLVEHGEVEY